VVAGANSNLRTADISAGGDVVILSSVNDPVSVTESHLKELRSIQISEVIGVRHQTPSPLHGDTVFINGFSAEVTVCGSGPCCEHINRALGSGWNQAHLVGAFSWWIRQSGAGR
jgi:hypothetical protein